jgi:hypothetical protein
MSNRRDSESHVQIAVVYKSSELNQKYPHMDVCMNLLFTMSQMKTGR